MTHIESGSGNPSLHNLIKVAAALQVSIEELLTRPRTDNETQLWYRLDQKITPWSFSWVMSSQV